MFVQRGMFNVIEDLFEAIHLQVYTLMHWQERLVRFYGAEKIILKQNYVSRLNKKGY